MRVAGIVEVAARLLLAVVDAPVCWRAFRPSLGGLLAVVGCWVHRGCLAVLEPVAVGAGVPGALRVLRGQSLVFVLRVRLGGGLPPRRCVGTVSCGAACASALAVAAAARSTARRILGSSAAVAAASAAACKAAAARFSAGLCCWTLEILAGSGPAAAEALAALAGWTLPLSLVLVRRFTSGTLLMTASA